MKSYRFSPIENKDQLLGVIKYTHSRCFELCKEIYGRYLPVAGNIGIFCHYEDEYKFLTKLRQELTEESDNWNKKYYRLYEPIIIPAQGDLPGATYTYFYVRKPDQHKEAGDIDFVLNTSEFDKLKKFLLGGEQKKGVEIFDRPGLDLIRLSDPSIDVLAFIGTKNMAENVGAM
ncbi:MAG: hypothetical protein PHS62_01360 [Patescibacteria group bacterium]|nr:hypothetical protein [Patescibacteria group bacterium]